MRIAENRLFNPKSQIPNPKFSMVLFTWVLLASTVLYTVAALAFFIGLFRCRKGASRARPFVSVVVAARNEERQIGGCLNALLRQTYPADRYEILVVDDDSTDRTPEIAGRIAAEHAHARCLPVGDAFPHLTAKKRPLSLGIREARGEIVLTTDADCRVPATWIAGMVACFEPDVGAVIGFSQIKASGSPLTCFERLQGFDFLALMSASAGAAHLGFPLAASGQNLAYRKALFEGVGGFGAIAHRPSGDDVLLIQLMRRRGNGRIVFAGHPETFVSTWRTESVGEFWQQRRRWASNAFYQLRLNRPFFVYITAVFLVNLLVPIGLITGFFGGGRSFPLLCWTAKALADLAVTWKGAWTFGRSDLLPVLPIWEILQAPYTVLVGLAGGLTGFTWKGRQYR